MSKRAKAGALRVESGDQLVMQAWRRGDNTVERRMRVVESQVCPQTVTASSACLTQDQIAGGDIPFPAFAQGQHAVEPPLRDQRKAIGQRDDLAFGAFGEGRA